jgi:hypothetical protein
MVVANIVIVFGCAAMLLMNLCNPDEIAGEVHQVCAPRFSPGQMAPFITAAVAGLGATTVFLYRANKQAEASS